MQRRLILLLLLAPFAVKAEVSFKQVKQVYLKIKKVNNIKCPPLVLVQSKEANASSSSKMLTITTGMLKELANDAEIARVIGHEMAHWMLHHNGSSVKNEYAADELGVAFMYKAGYNVCKGIQYLYRRGDPGGRTHPSDVDRAVKFCERQSVCVLDV